MAATHQCATLGPYVGVASSASPFHDFERAALNLEVRGVDICGKLLRGRIALGTPPKTLRSGEGTAPSYK